MIADRCLVGGMIEFRNVSKSYWTGVRRKVILDRANFVIDGSQSLGILAPNGTGKTTIIRMMAGLVKPDEGEIFRRSRISFPLGFMGGLSGRHSAAENARYIARLYGLDPDYVESYCRWLVELEEYFDQPINTYSSGMRARFGFALLLALDFDMYLIDEGMPAYSDAAFNRKAGHVLRERLKRSSCIIVSHDANILQMFCNNAAVLKDGRLHFFDSLEEAKQLYDYEH